MEGYVIVLTIIFASNPDRIISIDVYNTINVPVAGFSLGRAGVRKVAENGDRQSQVLH